MGDAEWCAPIWGGWGGQVYGFKWQKHTLKNEWQINYMANIAMKKLFVGEIKDMYTLVDI